MSAPKLSIFIEAVGGLVHVPLQIFIVVHLVEEGWNAASGFVVLWEFQVSGSMEGTFEQFYGADGDWVQLFRERPGFGRAELIGDLNKPRRYVTMDFSKTQFDYKSFRQDYSAAYEALNVRCRDFTTSGTELGSFCVVHE